MHISKTLGAVLLVGGLLLPFQTAHGKGESTVISVTGQVSRRSGTESAWRKVGAGEKLPAQVTVRTGAESRLRMITAGGAIISLAANQEREIGPSAPGGGDSAGQRLFRVLGEVFSSKKRQLQASSVSDQVEPGKGGPAAQTGSGAAAITSMSTAPSAGSLGGGATDWLHYDREWRALMAMERIPRGDLERVLRTAGFHSEPPFRNRTVALLVKLRESFPDDAGFTVLARQAWENFGTPAAMSLAGSSLGSFQPLSNGSTLMAGDGLRAEYRSEMESHLYAFLHSRSWEGHTRNVRVYPRAAMASEAVAAKSPLRLPARGVYGMAEQPVGRVILWAWSCAGPLRENETYREAVRRTEEAFRSQGGLSARTMEAVRRAAPPLCGQAFAFWFERG